MAHVHFDITLPDTVEAQLQKDADEEDMPASTLVSRYIEEHYAPAEDQIDVEVCQQKVTELEEEVLRERALAEQKAALKDTVISGLQSELEVAETTAKNLSERVDDLPGQIHDLKDDKQHLQKELERVTSRLPAPREGV